jgi:aryl-alcohol dehydrogenase-like predicted oxidoreductase
MEKRSFGNTGIEVSVIGFGAAPIGFLATEREKVARVLNTLLDGGMNLIDTAAAYPGSEEAIGDTVGHRRDEFILVSKCGQAFEDLPGEAWSAEVVSATVDRALRRLKTDYLDVMLLHTCGKDVLQKGDALGALVKAKEAGKIRFAGYAGDNEAAGYASGLPDISVLMASFNLVDQANIDRVLPIASGRRLGVIAKRPIANSAWKAPEEQPGMYRDYAQPYHERLTAMALMPDAFEVADWMELAIRFTLTIPGVHCGVIGTTNPDNARKNLAAAAKGPLSKNAFERIRSAFLGASDANWPGLQ